MNQPAGHHTLFALLALSTGLSLVSAAESLDGGFRTPPPEARPWVYWFFMDGNITREGITADLEAMARAGLGGGIFMEVDVGIPRGPVEFMSAPWQDLFGHAVRRRNGWAWRLTLNAGPGLDAAAAGRGSSPEQSMQHLVASETNVTGPAQFDARAAATARRARRFSAKTR